MKPQLRTSLSRRPRGGAPADRYNQLPRYLGALWSSQQRDTYTAEAAFQP